MIIDHDPECTSCVHDCPWKRHHFVMTTMKRETMAMIDLVAQGPVYRGHKLSRIIDEYYSGRVARGVGAPNLEKPMSTKAWARLDVRIIGNPWGLSVVEAADSVSELLD